MAVRDLCQRASKAMFSLLTKMSKFQLNIDTMLYLFSMVVKPVLLYGCEVWGASSENTLNMVEMVQLKFCKILLKLRKSTPSMMVYGETGLYPLLIDIKVRMICYWLKNSQTPRNKLSRSLMVLGRANSDCDWSKSIQSILNECGMAHVWEDRSRLRYEWIKNKVKLTLKDQFLQNWHGMAA